MSDWTRELLVPSRTPGPFGQRSAPCKLALLLLLGLWVVLVDQPRALVLPLVVLGPLIPLERLREVQLGALLGGGALILWSVMFSQGLFYQAVPREALVTLIPPGTMNGWEHEGLRLYREGLAYGVAQSARFIALYWCSLLIAFTTPLHQLLNTLRSWRVPGSLGLLALIALHSLPTLAQEILSLRRAFRLRRLSVRQLGFAGLMAPLTDRLLVRGHTLAAALQLRGIDPLDPELGPAPTLQTGERVVVAAACLFLIVALTRRVLMLLYWRGWWYQPDWTTVYAWSAWLTSTGSL